MQALKYLLYAFAMTVMGGRKEEASVVLSENGGVPAEELDALVLLEKGTNFYKPIGPQTSEMEPRTGIRQQCKKSSHGETQGRGPAPKSTAT